MDTKLNSVPETMLWTLHNRATEAKRTDALLKDNKAIEIYDAINYDYIKRFGKAEPSHAIRSLKFDQAIRTFLTQHPDGCIINLGEGLETQRYRFENEKALWFSVDLPEAIQVREQFIPPDQRHIHCSMSVLDRAWFNEIPKDRPVFITAQGLFMYFTEAQVQSLIADMLKTFQAGYLMFDTIPVWLSKKTLSEKGWQKTKYYTTPPMPWGINRNRIQSQLHSWSDAIISVEEVKYVTDFPRGIQKWLFPLLHTVPILRHHIPTGVKIRFVNHGPQD